MDSQTRNLLRLLTQEGVDRLLEALQDGSASETRLAALVGASQPTTNRRLNALAGWGIVASETSGAPGPSKRGQRPRVWRLSNPVVVRFCNSADALALELRETQARQLGEGLTAGRRAQLRALGDQRD